MSEHRQRVFLQLDKQIYKRCISGILDDFDVHAEVFSEDRRFMIVSFVYEQQNINHLAYMLDICLERYFAYVGVVRIIISNMALHFHRNDENKIEILKRLL